MPRWFLLDDGPSDGSWNMACDEYLFVNISRYKQPILRLYSFDPPAITIGYHQDACKVLDIDSVKRARVDVVRRVTGGRALLHKGEITYAVIGRDSDFSGAGTLVGSFERISRALARALRRIGIKADVYRERKSGEESTTNGGAGMMVDGGCADKAGIVTRNLSGTGGDGVGASPAGRTAPPCIASTTRFELNVGGRKIAGSAQRRSSGTFIQHGSIFLERGSEEIERYLKGRWKGLSGHMTTVEDEISTEGGTAVVGGGTAADGVLDSRGTGGSRDVSNRVGKVRIAELLMEGFSEEFGVEFERLELSGSELEAITGLARLKRKEFENPGGG